MSHTPKFEIKKKINEPAIPNKNKFFLFIILFIFEKIIIIINNDKYVKKIVLCNPINKSLKIIEDRTINKEIFIFLNK